MTNYEVDTSSKDIVITLPNQPPASLTAHKISSNEDLELLIQTQAKLISMGGIDEVKAASILFQSIGISANCHVGKGEYMDNSPQGIRLRLEWFAGALVELEARDANYGVNTWLNLAPSHGMSAWRP